MQLYIDTLSLGLGGCFYENNIHPWSEVTSFIQQDRGFAVPIHYPTLINIHELEAILLAVETGCECWSET